ncbi:Smr/MutS family protein [Methylocystis parvus]|uniref:DNA mismatch repair protein MutS n=1 Tax=Methylocystis parvus TaxID=134 RepID=A0A6B8M2H3_9HYPH|nr:Smr/MutS family protein [Methylocystis parvus]QGM97081.1 DNA mismatch repair protein MutS [Methylocystis parvus]WBJ99017.1 Smr/MutS family protein [Methylocystis parvus OBBP]
MSDDRRPYTRRLTHAEAELWTVVTASVRPFRARPAPVEEPAAPAHQPAEPLRVKSPAPVPHLDRPPPPKPPTPLVEIDHRTRVKIKRGRLDVSAKLDLHGLRQDEAQRALNAFLRRAQADGAKVAIVVTGKGLSREEGGILRRVVPMWLQAPNLRDVVVGFGEAARHHGGEGALYVQIRRADRRRG